MRCSRAKFKIATWAQLTGLCFAISVSAADPNAGLEPIPRWTSTDQLKPKWDNLPLPQLLARAEQGDPEAQQYLGWRYATGDGVPTNSATAAAWFQKAADQGFALSQKNLGALYMTGAGVPKDTQRAVYWFRRAADQGLPSALAALGELASGEKTADVKGDDARRFYELAAERGDAAAANALGYSHLRGRPGETIDPELALYWLTFAAKSGFPRAYSNLGWIYSGEWGPLYPRSDDEARRWFERAAKEGDGTGFLGLATLELNATNPVPDLAKARDWLLKAVDLNIPNALFALGRLSELRDIVHDPVLKPDYTQAAMWYQRAADAGHKGAANRLFELLGEGRIGSSADLPAQIQKAADMGSWQARLELARLYLKGAAKPRGTNEEPVALLQSLAREGRAEARLELADLYRTGHLVPKDPVQALMLIWSASIAPDAAERIDDLKEAARQNRPVAAVNQGLEQAYPLFIDALRNNQNTAATMRLANNYLDGTYPRNEIAAAAWFSLAAERGAPEAAARRDQLLQKLDPVSRQDAEKWGGRLNLYFKLGTP
jgi:TPR repeat protein